MTPRWRLRVRVVDAPDRWVALADGGRSVRLTTFPEHAWTASRASVEALATSLARRRVRLLRGGEAVDVEAVE